MQSDLKDPKSLAVFVTGYCAPARTEGDGTASARSNLVLGVAGSSGHSCLSLQLQGSSCTKRDEKSSVTVGSFCVVSSSAVPVVAGYALLLWEDSYQMLGHSEPVRLC